MLLWCMVKPWYHIMCMLEVWHTEMHMYNIEQVTYSVKHRTHSIYVHSSSLRQVDLTEEQWQVESEM